jgi:hypothetical protein
MEDFLKLTNSTTGQEIFIRKCKITSIEALPSQYQEVFDGRFPPFTEVYFDQGSNTVYRQVNETPEQIRQQWNESDDNDNKKNSKSTSPRLEEDDRFYKSISHLLNRC